MNNRILPVFLMLMTLILTLSLSGLAGALPLQNVEVEENVPESFTAGETQTMELSFENTAERNQTTIAKLDISSEEEEPPVWEGDFEVNGTLNTSTAFQREKEESEEYLLECEETDNGTFWCYNETRGGRIVLPKSENRLTLDIDSHPALYPANYTFGVELYAQVGVPEEPVIPKGQDFTEGKPGEIEGEREDGDKIAGLSITTNQNVTNATVNMTEYKFTILDSPSQRSEHVRSVEFEPDDELGKFIENATIRFYYEHSDVAGVNESLLGLFYWNEDSSSWEEVVPSTVNTVENYVEGDVPHLSMYSIYGSPPSTEDDTGGGGSVTVCDESDWECTEWSECVDGNQTRECRKTTKCYELNDLAPSETQSCEVEEETVQECPDCPAPSSWSKCIDGTQSRTNYRCSSETDFECVEYEEETDCEEGVKETPGGPTGPTEFLIQNQGSIVAGLVILIIAGGVLLYWKKKR